MCKIRIGGIKLSDELLGLECVEAPPVGTRGSVLCRVLAASKVNMPFVSSTYDAGALRVSCCVDAEDENLVGRCIASEPVLAGKVTFVRGVGLVSLFPHHFNMEVLGRAFSAFGRAGLPIHGMASSLSALTFVTAYADLDRAVETLLGTFELPEGGCPLKPAIKVKQI